MRDPLHIEIRDMSHMIPMRISVEKVKKMSDSELLAALNNEDGRKGLMTMQFLQLITSELQTRSIERAGKPHWSTVPSFWLLVTSVVLSLVAIVVAMFSLPQVQQRLIADQSQYQTPTPNGNLKTDGQSATKNLSHAEPKKSNPSMIFPKP